MTPADLIPAASPTWVRSLLAGTETGARVVHPGADAVYLDVDGACVGVLSTAATAVPCGVRTALAALPPQLVAASEARVGGGRIVLGGAEVVVTRTVDASVPSLPAAGVPGAADLLSESVGGGVDHVRAELPSDALAWLEAGDPAAVPVLLGRGSGLTPVGDDVLAGWLATGVAASRSGALPVPASATGPSEYEPPVGVAVAAHAATSTTLLSATLLDCARRGDVIPQFRTLLQGLVRAGTTEDRARLDEAVAALLRVGHTSGAGLMLGTLIALRHLASRSPS